MWNQQIIRHLLHGVDDDAGHPGEDTNGADDNAGYPDHNTNGANVVDDAPPGDDKHWGL